MRYAGAVLVKPENSLHSYDTAQNAVMHYDTSKHYKTVCFQNIDVVEMFEVARFSSLKLLYEINDQTDILKNDIFDKIYEKYHDEFFFPSAEYHFYTLPDVSPTVNIDKITEIDDYHCDVSVKVDIMPPNIDYCTEVKDWSWWNNPFRKGENPTKHLSGATVRELKATGLSPSIIRLFELMIDDDMNDLSVADIMASDKYDDYYLVMVEFRH